MSKNMMENEGPQMTSQYGAYALHAGLSRLHALMLMHTPTRPGTHMHVRTRMHVHRQTSNTHCFSTATMIRESFSKLRDTYFLCLVCFELVYETENGQTRLVSGRMTDLIA
jgi:hypothetical protein